MWKIVLFKQNNLHCLNAKSFQHETSFINYEYVTEEITVGLPIMKVKLIKT